MFDLLNTEDFLLRRKNGPPVMELLPSEMALNDVHEGLTSLHEPGQVIKKKKSFDWKGAMGQGLKGLSDISRPTMVAPPVQFELDGRQSMQGLRYGGRVRPNLMYRVGENGPETFVSDEPGIIVPNKADGGEEYLPDNARDPNLPQPITNQGTGGESLGIDQTIIDTPGQNPAAAMENFGWNSDTPEMKAKRDYDLNRAPTLDEDYRALNEAQQIKSSPWKDAGAALIQGFANWANGTNNPVKTYGEIKAERRSAPIARRIALKEAQRKAATDDAYRRAQEANIYADNERMAGAAHDLSEWRKEETARKREDRVSREQTARMNAVAGMFKTVPVYDPTDPKFKELTEALGDVGLPLTPKDVKKKVDLKQDQRTGQWTVILTDPISGQQEVRNVEKDGKPFASTPTVVMQGEYGLLKQNDQQQFQAGENDKNRQLRIQMQQNAIAAQKEAAILQAALQQGNQKAAAESRAKLQQMREQDKAYRQQLEEQGLGAPVGVDISK